ncbi:hypothetical protein K450DRAFT_239705 [Umbelopsis ramanniana AG]|uniref:F-box domain-containing protein n=1 Tax=Umbelopsis ramanniana AG TaxID=1314678 RepID=A0AAD5E9K1_UMBRA|nr:uncharacterized protein K450DRAFT_239705 [Umbelopsis ramanniana AG]KAI8579913.1 hypothetical protein K450DRAFT_239705 [Umbelopsis ramanniana AG]
MTESKVSYIPLEIWLIIIKYLQPQDVLNSASTCRDWYKPLTNQILWQEVYKAILPEYATDHFCITDMVKNVKRLDINLLDGSEPTYLHCWPESFKQRTVYLQHIIHVQSKAVKALRENTQTFEKDIKAPILDMVRIKEMEDSAKSALPIDLVIFMYYFAHHLPVIQPETMEEGILPLASGEQFETTYDWLKLYDKFNVRRYMRSRPRTPAYRLQKVSPATMKYMLQFNFAPFAQVDEYECDDVRAGLSVMLSKNNEPPADLPPYAATEGYEINLEKTVNSIGKVFFIYSQYCGYMVQYLAESFTDYLMQYTGTALKYGEVPQYEEAGVADLHVDLPRDQSPRTSILLPQPIDCWDISSYFPTYFTQEHNTISHFSWKKLHFKNVE